MMRQTCDHLNDPLRSEDNHRSTLATSMREINSHLVTLDTRVDKLEIRFDTLEVRVEKLDNRVEAQGQDIHQIKIDIATLNERAGTFATKTDLADLRSEMYQGFSGIRHEIIHQTRWMTSTIFGVAALCMTAAKLFY